jgi:prolyl oligopeptidase
VDSRKPSLRFVYFIFIFSICSVSAQNQPPPDPNDPFGYLEVRKSKPSLQWVKQQNKNTLDELQSHPEYEKIKRESEEILLSDDRLEIPDLYLNGYIYGFWEDKKNPKGLWRRTTLEEYRKEKPHWEILLDFDELSKKEDENWVLKDVDPLYPEGERFLISLSRGGGDAAVLREFDVKQKKFVADGFNLKEAKSRVEWFDKNHIFVSTDFGEGSLTKSGYPRIVKLWKRGTPLSNATTLFEAQSDDVSARASRDLLSERKLTILSRHIDFFTAEHWILNESMQKAKIPFPNDTDLEGEFQNSLLGILRSDWNVGNQIFKAGSLVSVPLDSLDISKAELLFEPNENSSIDEVFQTKDRLYVQILENVIGKVFEVEKVNSEWSARKLDLPDMGKISILDADHSGSKIFLTFENFLTPPSVIEVDVDAKGNHSQKVLKKLLDRFDATKFEVKQYKVKSTGAVEIPYFVVQPKGIVLDNLNPTLLVGYGGFEISFSPAYSGSRGKSWLSRGGVYVIANIRGGGEFGPMWHQAATKENRQIAYNDFANVAKDLIERGITSPSKLGVEGGSNGGLLTGVFLTQEPTLCNAVICNVPLLDMLRYHLLPAGDSWIGEYGDPSKPKEAQYIRRYSPYHNVNRFIRYPKAFFLTSTADDRVHPAHARKMAARLRSFGNDVLYYENTDGGHAGAADPFQEVLVYSLRCTYLVQQLGMRALPSK